MSTRDDGPPSDPGVDPAPQDGDEPRTPLAPYLNILHRAVRSLRAFFAAHVIVVRSEAERELTRVIVAAGFIIAAAMFALASAILFSTGLVVGIQRVTGLPWLESLGISLVCTLLIGLLLAAIGYWRIKKPLMPESRELLQKTLDGLSQR